LAAEYALAPAALDQGGLQAGSANYSASFSAAPGGEGGSSNYRMRSGYAGQLFDPDALPDVDIVPPGSLAADGSGKSFSASAAGVEGLVLTYEGRGFTSYASTSSAPAIPGLYRLSVSSLSQDFIGSAYRDFVISGPIAGADFFSKPVDTPTVSISLTEMLANDIRVLPDGSVSSAGLSIVGVTPGSGNSVLLGEGEDAGWIFFMSSSASAGIFSYVVSDGVSTANGEVTVTTLAPATPLGLQIVRHGIPEFDGSRTTLTMDFIGVPGQAYQMEWSADLSTWISAGTSASGLSGFFTVTLSREGDHLTSWNQSLFFRAKH
jgi:hypothetical protein